MEKYYIIRVDGSSIFELPYPKDFCIHCLCLLIEDGHRYRLLASTQLEHISLFACDGFKFKLQLNLGESRGPQLSNRITPNCITE